MLEEIGISIDDSEIERPFMKVTFMNKDWPEQGKNRKAEIYYYIIKTSKIPDLTKTSYTENEKNNNYTIETFKVSEAIDKIKENMPNHAKNKVISQDMIFAIEEYLKQIGG